MKFKILVFFLMTGLSALLFSLDSKTVKEISRVDEEVMRTAGISIQETLNDLVIEWSKPEAALFELGKQLLNESHDVINAYRVFNYLSMTYKKDIYYLFLGQCYYFMGEMYYEGYVEKYYKKAYEIFKRLEDKDDENVEYLKWFSFSAAKVGGFIKHKERGTFSGLSYLKESVSINDDLLDEDKKNEDGLLTEAEYQIETDSVPIFGGSEKKGVKIFNEVLKKNPNSMRGNLLLGKYYYTKKNDPGRGIPYLLKAADVYDQKLVPQNMLNYYMRIFLEMHLIRAYGRMGNQDKVWEHIQKHLSLLPRSPSGLSALADYLGNIRKDRSAACVVARRLTQMDPHGRKQDVVARYCQ